MEETKKRKPITRTIERIVVGRQLSRCRNEPPRKLLVFDKHKIPGELLDYSCPAWVSSERKGNFDESGYQIDHIIPLAQGGADDETNMQALCHSCHAFKTRLDNDKSRLIRSVGSLSLSSKDTVISKIGSEVKSKIGSEVTSKIGSEVKKSRTGMKKSQIKQLCLYYSCPVKSVMKKDELVDALEKKFAGTITLDEVFSSISFGIGKLKNFALCSGKDNNPHYIFGDFPLGKDKYLCVKCKDNTTMTKIVKSEFVLPDSQIVDNIIPKKESKVSKKEVSGVSKGETPKKAPKKSSVKKESPKPAGKEAPKTPKKAKK